MKKYLLFVLLFLSVFLFLQAQTPRVLFIGNSYTHVNDLPTLIYNVARSVGDDMEFESNTPGGSTFSQHCQNNSMSMICQGNWDFVVLQEQSQYPSFPLSQVQAEVFPYAEALNDSIEKYNPCAETIFFMTWGRENGDPQWGPISTYQGMDDSLFVRYMYMAEVNDAVVAPVGRVWRYIRENYPSIQLYSADGSHPSFAGSYAAACTFYSVIFEKDPTLITYIGSLDPQEATIIRNVVKQIVYQDFSTWFVGTYNPIADFNYTIDENFNYHFQNSSLYCQDYFWDFGDGNSSTEFNPIHFYENSGTYTVTLIGEKCGLSDNKVLTIQAESSIQEHLQNNILFYPNPVEDELRIEFLDVSYRKIKGEVYNIDGKLVYTFDWTTETKNINLSHLSTGIYSLILKENNQSIYKQKILKR